MITIDFNTDELKSKLQQFAKDIKEKAIRPAAFAGSEVLYKEMKINVPVFDGKVYLNKTGKRAGKYNATPGQLRGSIYQYHNTKLSVGGNQVYSIGVNKKKAFYWHMVERGTKNQPAKPFIVTTYDSKITAALEAAKAVLQTKVREIANG